ncbi:MULTISPECIES: EamA family transporter [Eubacterium]|uniref:EamA family transporter n=1 Tax=Eubacterium TaxID=1730 RepID=UPI001315022D|nr:MULTISPECIES: EamA family transporter [Eubacterium]
MIYLLIFSYLCCSVGGLILVKFGAENNNFIFNSSFFSLSLSYTTLIGLCLYIVSFLMWIIVVQKFNLSFIQPITSGLSYILIICASIFILKESISRFQWIGLIFILVGVVFMNLKTN